MATKEQIDQCLRIQRLAMQVSAQGKIQVHVQYWGHTDEFQVWANLTAGRPLIGWDTRDHQCYLGEAQLTSLSASILESTEAKLILMLKVDADGVPL